MIVETVYGKKELSGDYVDFCPSRMWKQADFFLSIQQLQSNLLYIGGVIVVSLKQWLPLIALWGRLYRL